MRSTTEIIIKKYALIRLKHDFMGYPFQDVSELSFHHLVLPHSVCKGKIGGGYELWNGAVLNQDTSHDYLHTIERYDYDRFVAITSEMLDENIQGYLDYRNIAYINDILDGFEKEYFGELTKKGTPVIKEEYLNRVLKK